MSHNPASLNGKSTNAGMTKTNSTSQGGNLATPAATAALKRSHGSTATTRAAAPAQRSQIQASNRNRAARMNQNGRSRCFIGAFGRLIAAKSSQAASDHGG